MPPQPARILMLFVDGLGLSRNDDANPVASGACPHLRQWLETAWPLDAQLGTPGTPQSATGQTTLLTGRNAAACMGRHVEGFPGARLRAMIRESNLFQRTEALGRRATFANAYSSADRAVIEARPQSVTTVATLSAFGAVRGPDRLARNEAVYHDLTREGLRSRGYQGPLVAPEEAAEHLLAIAASHHMTLFEFFETDRAGHAASMDLARSVLGRFDRFLGRLLAAAQGAGLSVVLTSDHGNIEDTRTPWHTGNPVPLAMAGVPLSLMAGDVRDLSHVEPALIRVLAAGSQPDNEPTGHQPAWAPPSDGVVPAPLYRE